MNRRKRISKFRREQIKTMIALKAMRKMESEVSAIIGINLGNAGEQPRRGTYELTCKGSLVAESPRTQSD